MHYADAIYTQLNRAYLDWFGHVSVANNYEIDSIMGTHHDQGRILLEMYNRLGEPSASYVMRFEDLPRIKQEDTVQGKVLKTWEKFPEEIRGEAIKRLASRGMYVWSQTFDPHSREVREVCQAIEDDEPEVVKKEKPLYTFTADMLAEQRWFAGRRMNYAPFTI